MYIKNQTLTVQLVGDRANITIAFTVVLNTRDIELVGGFLEQVGLEGTSSLPHGPSSLSLRDAVEIIPGTGWKELYRNHTFQVSRYPQGVFKTAKFHGSIKVWPVIQVCDEKVTGEGVLPAKYALSSRIRNFATTFRSVFRR